MKPVLLFPAFFLFAAGALLAQPQGTASADSVRAVALIAESKQNADAGNHPKALEKARQAYELFAARYGPGHLLAADAAMYVARELRALSQSVEAADLNRQCLAVFEAQRDTFRSARCLHNLALALREQRRFEDAYAELRRAVALLGRDSTRNASLFAAMQVNLGSILIADKNYRAALAPLESARHTYETLHDDHATAMVGYHLGTTWLRLHDIQRARENFLDALASLRGHLPPTHTYFADLYVKIALCCQQLDAADDGLAYMAQAREVYLINGPDNAEYVDFLQNFGLFYLREKRFADAIEQLERCRALRTRDKSSNPYLVATTLELLGQAYTGAGRYEQADAAFRAGLSLVRDSLSAHRKQRFQLYGYLAEVQLQLGDAAASRALADTAFVVAGFDPRHWEAMLPRDLGRELCQRYGRALFLGYRQSGDTALLRGAEYYHALAVRILLREVEEISGNSAREIYYDRDYTAFEQWLDVRVAQFNRTGATAEAEAAFRAAAKGKAFLLAQLLGQHAALQQAGVPDSLLQVLYGLRDQIVAVENTLAATAPAFVPGNYDGLEGRNSALRLNHELSGLRVAYDAVMRRIQPPSTDREVAADDLGYPLGQWRSASIDELRGGLAPDQALLMYSTTQTNFYAFVLTHDTLIIRSLPTDTTTGTLLTRFTSALTDYHTAPDPDDAAYDRALDRSIVLGQVLYRQLVAPVAAFLPARVVIVPEGQLWYLPFEALLTGAPSDDANFRTYPFWLCEKAISYALAPHLPHAAFDRPPPAAPALKPWLGIAPFAGTNTVAASRTGYAALPFTGEEISAIAPLFGGDVWLNETARPGRFRQEAAQYRVLHLATHSRADVRHGHYGSIATSSTGDPLIAKDLAQLALAADLVVLSACETGGGRLRRGEGVIGLVRAFTQAGARSVVASLWPANDQSTARLMLDFYQGLRRGRSKDQALQQARLLQLQRGTEAAHPFFWAGFRVYGDASGW